MAIAADVTDMVAGWRHMRTPSGVTRVQARLLQAGAGLFGPVGFADGAWRCFPPPLLDQMLGAAGQPGGPKDPAWQALVDAAEAELAAAPAWRPAADDWLFGIGAGWWLPGHAARILALKRDGVAYANFVHDVLPLTVPEHCSAALVRSFAQHFALTCLLADHVVCNSEASRVDFAAWQRRLLPGQVIPASVLRLDGASARPAQPGRRDFVLAVGTVESRKNQLGLLRAWLRLLREHGEAAVPRLVIVGLHGHWSEQVVELCEASPELRRAVEFRHAVPDAELDALYAGCIFTVFNSYAEGWGLPVSESLAHGRVPLVTDLPVLREAGGAHAVYVEVDNVPALAAAAWALIGDPAGLRAREGAMRAAPPPPSWRELAERCAAFLGSPPALALDRAPLPAGLVVPCGLPPMPDLPVLPPPQQSTGALLRSGNGWSHQEDWGCWAVAPGELALRLPLDPAWRCPAVRLSLHLMPPPGGHVVRARAAGGAWVNWPITQECWVVLDAAWPMGDVLEVAFDVGRGVAVPPDHRMLGFGLRALSLTPGPMPAVAPAGLLTRFNPLRKP